jgi:hypothetical protein
VRTERVGERSIPFGDTCAKQVHLLRRAKRTAEQNYYAEDYRSHVFYPLSLRSMFCPLCSRFDMQEMHPAC